MQVLVQGVGRLKALQLASEVGGDLIKGHGFPENEHDLGAAMVSWDPEAGHLLLAPDGLVLEEGVGYVRGGDDRYRRCIDLVPELLLGPLTSTSNAFGTFKNLLVRTSHQKEFGSASLILCASPSDEETAGASWASSRAIVTAVEVARWRMKRELQKKRRLALS